MTKIILAPDKFRGSLTAAEVCLAMSEGIRSVVPDAYIVAIPMADGGEGTTQILTQNAGGQMRNISVLDPIGRPIEASYGLSGQTAYIEMAAASGLKLLKPNEYNPLKTSTFGTGKLIEAAIKDGATELILGIGGSATNDGGMGMAAALGWVFLDKDNNEIVPNGENLFAIQKIVPPNTSHLKSDITITVACDVNAPLFGLEGAAQVFSPQKGATAEMVVLLDNGLQHLAMVVKRDFGRDLAQVAGAGAAGGLGFGLLFFLNASLKEGIKIVMEQTHFAEHLTYADLVLTGEGKIDQQTLQGKLIAGIVQAAKVHHVPVIALCGTLALSPHEIQQLGLTYATSILPRPMSLDEAINGAYKSVKDSTANVFQFLKNIGKL